jgi:hypothetical protein
MPTLILQYFDIIKPLRILSRKIYSTYQQTLCFSSIQYIFAKNVLRGVHKLFLTVIIMFRDSFLCVISN